MYPSGCRPSNAKEANGRNAMQRLHDKLYAMYGGKHVEAAQRGDYYRPNTVVKLVDEIILSLCFAIEEGKLTHAAHCMFQKLTRAEILCWLLQEAAYVYRLNKERYGYKEEKEARRFGLDRRTPQQALLDNIFRLTREELIEKYGAEDWHSHYRVDDKVYESDVAYGKFLRDNGLNHRYGANITKADLPPIDMSALYGDDVLAKADTMRRLAREGAGESVL